MTLAPADRAFLVDFDDTVSLRQPLTQDKALLLRGIDRLIPFGGTAINDGILFSLLQYGREPGRRALVVVTDGDDEHSRSRPEQSADYAARLGLPIYFIELDPTATRTEAKDGWVVTDVSAALRRKKARKRLEPGEGHQGDRPRRRCLDTLADHRRPGRRPERTGHQLRRPRRLHTRSRPRAGPPPGAVDTK